MGWPRIFRRAYWDDERRRELESYVEIETDDNIARGMPPTAAREAAYRKLGNPTLIREDIYRMNSIVLETLWLDLRYGARVLRRNPGFAAVAILSLALGVGANTAIFQLIDAVAWKPLPVHEPDRLVEIGLAHPESRVGSFTGRRPTLTNALWEHIRDRQQAFDGVFAWNNGMFNLAAGGEVRYADGLYVSGALFETLGVKAAAGRLLTRADDRPGCGAPGIVVSFPFAEREFGTHTSAVGRSLRIEGRPYDIVGVTEPRFFGVDVGRSFDVAVPLCAEPIVRGSFSSLNRPAGWFLASMGRLKPGWTIDQANAHLKALAPAVFRDTLPPVYNQIDVDKYLRQTLTAVSSPSGVSTIRSRYETPLWALMATTALVLLIACANLANLMLARATARQREIAVRLAIGASRWRIVRQLMAESLLLATLGAAAGAMLAQWLAGFLVSFLSVGPSRMFVDLDRDWRMFAFAATLAVLTCLLFGLTPAVQATRSAPVSAMKTGGRSVTDSRERFGLRRSLVVVQVALSLLIMIGALLFARSLRNLLTVDLGFEAQGLVVATLDLRRANIPPERTAAALQDITARLAALPGVEGAAQVGIIPVSGSGWNETILIDGKPQQDYPNFNRVSPGFFRTMRTRIVAGRDFEDRDTISAAPVAIVNEAFTRKYFAGTNALGRTFLVQQPPGAPRPQYTIVGVVQDTAYSNVRQARGPITYLPAAQDAEQSPFLQLLLRSTVPHPQLVAQVSRAVADINPAIPIDFDTIGDQIRQAVLPERLMAMLSGFFGALAALIATIGLYGVMSYMVTRRRNEIGLRMALGADRRRVTAMILREGTVLAIGGIVVGVALALVAGRWATTLLYEVKPYDPVTIAASIGLLAAVAALASYMPAQRAARMDPSVALRQE